MNEELARRLAVAFMSYQLGIGMDYTRKNYFKDSEPMGAFWLELAELVSIAMVENLELQLDPEYHQ